MSFRFLVNMKGTWWQQHVFMIRARRDTIYHGIDYVADFTPDEVCGSSGLI